MSAGAPIPGERAVQDRVLSLLALTAAGFAAALGGVVVAGWMTGTAALIQTHPTFPPMQYNAALGFLFCGAGLLAALGGRPRLALAGGLLTILLGLLSVLQNLFDVDAGIDRLLFEPVITTLTARPGRVSPNSAVGFLLAGAAILVIRCPGHGRLRAPALALSGTVLMAFGFVGYLGYLANLPRAYGWGRLTCMAVQDTVGFAVLGGGVLAVAWREDRAGKQGMPPWLPIPVGLGLAVGVVCLWRALAAQASPPLPTITLLLGLALSTFVVWSLRLLLTESRLKRQAEAANRSLRDEISDHRRTMACLSQHASDLEQSLNSMRTEARIILSILNSMGDGVVVVDPEGKILLFNPEAERVLGLGAVDEPLEAWSSTYGFFRSDQATHVPTDALPFLRALRGEGVDGIEIFIRNPFVPEGHWASMGGRPLRGARGEIQGAVIVLRDVTAYKVSERMKDEFVSVVSHELRTPLTAIQGALGLVLGGVAGVLTPQAQTMLGVAHRNGVRLTQLINDILDIQKIEAGRMVFRRESIDLQKAVDLAIESNAGYARTYNVTVEEGLRCPGTRIEGDAVRLGQVLANLLSNAVKFSPPEGRVHVDVIRTGASVRVAVIDHGAGVPEGFRDRIFQKFAQADSTDTRQKGGTGLGLSICKAIVERLGGRIGYASEPGVRTTFYFDLPDLAPEGLCTRDDVHKAATTPAVDLQATAAS